MKKSPATLKVATYNVNGINGRLEVLLRWLKQSDPDVVCLQELKAPQDKFPLNEIRKAGYHALWHGQKSWNGVAILSKDPDIREIRKGLPGDPSDLHSRYIEVITFDIVIACLYLPNGNPYPGVKFDYKLKWIKRLHTHVRKLLAHGVPVMLIGDFNVMPTPFDVYKPEKYINDALFRKEVRTAYAKLLALGYTDALRKLYPREVIYTFWDYFRNAFNRNAGMRIDHFLLSKDVAKRLKKAGVDKDVRSWPKTSDHAPVWVQIAQAKK